MSRFDIAKTFSGKPDNNGNQLTMRNVGIIRDSNWIKIVQEKSARDLPLFSQLRRFHCIRHMP